MPPEPKPPPCSWCHWPVRLVPAPRGAESASAEPPDAGEPAPSTDEPPRVRQCTNPWCPTRRPGFGVAP